MGLDQYLHAKVYVPRLDWPQQPVTNPTIDGLAASLEGTAAAVGLGLSVQPIPVPRGEPIVNPNFLTIAKTLGFEDKDLDGLLAETTGIESDVKVGYWRKQNQIQGWIESQVGEVENCKHLTIERSQLEDLVRDCQAVLDTFTFGLPEEKTSRWGGTWTERKITGYDRQEMHERHLEPTSGFFYGGEEIDDYYVAGLEETVKQVGDALKHPALIDAEFSYYAWW